MIELLRFLAARAVPGLEEATETTYRRSLPLEHGNAVVALGTDGFELRVDDARDRPDALARCRRLLKRFRAGETGQKVTDGIHLTINAIATALRNSG